MVAFYKPKTLSQALDLLCQTPDALPLSGGQSLVAMLNLKMIQPAAIVSLNGIEELRGIKRATDGSVIIGARATHREVAMFDGFVEGQTLIGEAAGRIANTAVRNSGTLGGACAQGDPTSDWPAALCAVDASFQISSRSGARSVLAKDFFLQFLTTALQPGEVIVNVRIPPMAGRSVYHKFCRVGSDNATVSVACVGELVSGVCRSFRLAAGSVGATPIRIRSLENMIEGQRPDPALLGQFAQDFSAQCDPISDVRGSAHYKRRVVQTMAFRAAKECLLHD